MEHKPDSIRAIVLVFAIGLAITGFTSLQASEEQRSAKSAATPTAGMLISKTEMAPVPLARMESR